MVRQSKSKSKKFTPRKLMSWVLISFVIGIAFNFGQGFYQMHQLKTEIVSLEQDLYKLKNVNKELQNEVEYLSSPEAIEKIARERLGLIQQGETIILRARDGQ